MANRLTPEQVQAIWARWAHVEESWGEIEFESDYAAEFTEQRQQDIEALLADRDALEQEVERLRCMLQPSEEVALESE